jgi:hypothetical protein
MALPKLFQSLAGTLLSSLQIGIGGIQIKSSGGKAEIRDAAGTGYAVLRAMKDPADADAVVTNGQVAAHSEWIVVPFGTSTVSSTATIPDGAIVVSVITEIGTAFDNAATVEIGTDADADAFAAAADVDPTAEGQYVRTGAVPQDAGSAKAIKVTIANAPTVGAGSVLVQFVTPAS